MKSKSKKLISALTVLALICNMILPSLSFAVETGVAEAKVQLSKKELERGDEVTVSFHLNTNGTKGVKSSQTLLNFDPDVVEPVGTPTLNSEFTSIIPEYPAPMVTITDRDNEEDPTKDIHRINFFWSSGANDFELDYNGVVFTATFKVIDGAKLGKATFELVDDKAKSPIVCGMDMSTGGIIEIPYTVQNADINVIQPVNSISLNKETTELWVNETEKLTVTYDPQDATTQSVTWSSSDNSVATVTPDGTITAVGKGTATITAKTSNAKEDKCEVIVKQPVTGISLNKNTLELEKGETETLTATVLPGNADGDKTVTWSSSAESVATVENGVVTAVGKGSATITAKTANGIEAKCSVTVGVPLKGISFKDNVTEKTINRSEQFTLEVVFNPTDTDVDKTIKWSSTDTSVATVVDGVVTAVGDGETVITATASNGMTATCKVKVIIPLNSISIKESTSILCGGTEKLEVTYNPVDTTDDKTISWTSDNEEVATVSTDGTVTAKGVGTANIKATTSKGLEATCAVTVLPVELESIIIKEQNITINKGQSQDLTIVYVPENATEDKGITWSSENDEIVSVSENGTITAHKVGKITITATAENGEEATTIVDVKSPLVSISLNETEKQLNKGETLQLNVTFNPDDTTDDKTISWTSTDDAVASVENGLVTAKSAGTAYIKASVGELEVTCKIDVKVPLEGIELNKETTEILRRQEEKLQVKLNPEDATYEGDLVWTSSDETVATVDENGVITAIKAGTTTITVKAVEGEEEFTDTCTVTVKEIPLNSITINMPDFDLGIGETQQLGIFIEPEDTTDDLNIEWSSSDPEIVKVDENGLVTAVSEGTATITVKAGDKEASVKVTAKVIPITSISLEGTDTKVLVGSPVNVKITVLPTNATYDIKDLKVISSNSDVITVNEDGTVIAKGLGKAVLTVEAPNGVKSQVEIEVVDSTADTGNEENTENNTNTSTEVNDSNSPHTADIAVEMWIALMIISGAGIGIILKRKLKK